MSAEIVQLDLSAEQRARMDQADGLITEPVRLPGEWQLRIRQVAGLLGYSEATVYRLIDSGKLKAVKCGNTTRVTMYAIREFQKANAATGPRIVK